MFQSAITSSSHPQSPRSLAASITVHGAIVLSLFTIQFSRQVSSFALKSHVTLVAPVETPAKIAKSPVRIPKTFHAPAAPVTEAPPKIVLDLPRPADQIPAAPPLEIPAMPKISPAPVLKTEAFEARPTIPVPQPKLAIHESGFATSAQPANTSPARALAT